MSRRTSAPVAKDLPLSVFVHEDQVYTSPTRVQFPARGPPPPSDSPTAVSAPSSSTWLHCMWGKRDYLELAFYPTSTRLMGSAFQCLSFCRQDMIPLAVQQPHPDATLQYRTTHADEWMMLEVTLIQVRNLLQDHHTAPVLVSLEKQPIPGPSSEGYGNWSTDRQVAQARAYFARRKFMYHIAIISFHIAALWHRTGDPHHWYDYLLGKGVKGHILDSFSTSVLADFTPDNPRAGLFVNPNECPWVNYLPILITAKVPVFVFWGPVSGPAEAPPGFEKLQPSENDVSAAPTSRSVSAISVGLGQSNDATSSSAYRAAHLRVETEEQKKARLSREKRAARYQITKDGGDKLFEWDFDSETMRWRRVHVPRHEREDRWREFDSKYKRYDPVAEEWDLAWFLDCAGPQLSIGQAIDPVIEEDDTERQSYSNPSFRESDYQLDPPVPHPFSHKETKTFQPTYEEVSHVEDTGTTTFTTIPTAATMTTATTTRTPAAMTSTCWSPIAMTTSIPTSPTFSTASTTTTPAELGELGTNEEWHPIVPTLQGVLMSRHLFRWGISDLPTLPPGKYLDLVNVCKAVGFSETGDVRHIFDTEQEAKAFAHWVSCIVQDSAPPADWWLLNPKSLRFRDIMRTADLRVFNMDDPYQHVRLWCLDDRHHPRYMRTWFIAVENASTALAVASSVRSVDEAVRWMLASGVSFRSLMYSARVATLIKAGHTMADPNLQHRLLIRPMTYTFGALDYQAYEEVRDHFLRANPRIGRAALLAGGIVWRLAIETTAPNIVLDGPDAITYARGITFALRDSADNVFVDDNLAEDEIQIIVGTYIREPLNRHNFSGAGFPMWWPNRLHFDGSSLNCGWWSPTAEEWYCDLRAQYRMGESQPKTGPQWRKALRNRDKHLRIFTENSKKAAAASLCGIST